MAKKPPGLPTIIRRPDGKYAVQLARGAWVVSGSKSTATTSITSSESKRRPVRP
jgi:hypothetical protein